ncbi:hypothetical protein OH77DRAFT_32657 [Trametes cingulata]|nr:hypothetical protein OH77DRAFT_32657 [Trametes cingulata]
MQDALPPPTSWWRLLLFVRQATRARTRRVFALRHGAFLQNALGVATAQAAAADICDHLYGFQAFRHLCGLHPVATVIHELPPQIPRPFGRDYWLSMSLRASRRGCLWRCWQILGHRGRRRRA